MVFSFDTVRGLVCLRDPCRALCQWDVQLLCGAPSWICRLVTVRVIWTKNDVTLTKMSSAGVNGTEPQDALQ